MIHKTEQLLFSEDYKVLVKSLYANTGSVQVYGGEDVEVADTYGKVFISIRGFQVRI